ncbi:Gti1/Pac2 family-domain-containing protein [Cladochytrium replicatum]|nr:Gti1/Pac2 family-domain-containing protein [Cladochytrium replicatum]
MSSSPLPIGSIETFYGLIETTHDALIVFESCRLGLLQRVGRRLHETERKEVRSGSVFVYNEKESSIKRWTDGRLWSPSRILGNFLVYKELDKKIQKKGQRFIRDGKNLVEVDGKRAATGSKGTYLFKEAGLIKKTITASMNGEQFHLVAYYTKADLHMGRLKSPRSNTILADVAVPDDLLHDQNFRKPPSSKPPPLVTTQQRLRRARNPRPDVNDSLDEDDESEDSFDDGDDDELSDVGEAQKRHPPTSEPFDLFPGPSPTYTGIHMPNGTQVSPDILDLAMFGMDHSHYGEQVSLSDDDEGCQPDPESLVLHFDPSFPTDPFRSSPRHLLSFPHAESTFYSSSAPSSSGVDLSRGSPISRSSKRIQARQMSPYRRFPPAQRHPLHHPEEKVRRISASAPRISTATRSSFPILTQFPQHYIRHGTQSQFQVPSALGFAPSIGSSMVQPSMMTSPVFVRADGFHAFAVADGGMAYRSLEAIPGPLPQSGYNPPDLGASPQFLRLATNTNESDLIQSFIYVPTTSTNYNLTQSYDSGASEIPEFILSQYQQSLYSPDSVVSTATSSSVGSYPFFGSTTGSPPAASTSPLSNVFGVIQGDVLNASQSAPVMEKLDGMLLWSVGNPSNNNNLFHDQTDVGTGCGLLDDDIAKAT